MTTPPSISADENPYGLELFEIEAPNGLTLHLQTRHEAENYIRQKNKYLNDNKFSNISDLEDLSRILMLETIFNRYSSWIAQGFDYTQAKIDESKLKTDLKEISTELRQLKISLGIDRATREKDSKETLGDYIDNLLKRAKEHGVHRDKQYETSVTFIWELISQVKTYDRCDEEERRELNLTPTSILQWVRDQVLPEWEKIEESYRKNQKIWIQEI